MSDSVQPHRQQPIRFPRPWDSPGKNTGVGCHFLRQYMKVKNESEVTQSCPTLCNPMDCSLPGSSVHEIFQARVLEWGAITSTRMIKFQNTDNTKCWQGCGATETLIHCWWEGKMAQLVWETVFQFLTKLNILLTSDTTTALLGIYPKKLKTYV